MSRRGRGLGAVVLVLLLGEVGTLDLGAGPFEGPPRYPPDRWLDTEHVALVLSFDWEQKRMDAVATLRLRLLRPLREVPLDAKGLRVAEARVSLDGVMWRQQEFRVEPERLVVQLPEPLPSGKPCMVQVRYSVVDPPRGIHFVAPRPKEPHKKPVVWTQSEPEDARYWFPCFDSPRDRLTSEVIARVPKNMMVLSNGVLKARQDVGDGTVQWHWVQEQNHVAYLISVVAGEFVAYEQTWDGIPITSYVPPGYETHAPRSFGNTPKMMELFSRLVGIRYPWPKYAQICCDEYEGGMEHTSATTLELDTLHDERAHEDVSSDGLVAHELAHQWWGNLLTCADWSETWLNEGFATYFASLWTEHNKGWDEAAWERHERWQSYQREAERYRRPMVTRRFQDPWAMFDAHAYSKGARVLHLLRFLLGDEAFFSALSHYARKHAYGLVETGDLRRAVEEVTGRELSWFLDQWVYRPGHPELELEGVWDEGERRFRLRCRQVQHRRHPNTPIFRIPVEITFWDGGGERREQVELREAEEVFVFALPEGPTSWCFDGRDWVPEERRVHRSVEDWVQRALRDPHMLCRYEAVQSLQELGRPDVVEALVRVLQKEPFWAVRAEAARRLELPDVGTAQEALRRALAQDPDARVRRAAAEALAAHRGQLVEEALTTAIGRDRSYYVVAASLRSLARVNPARARPLLMEALKQRSHDEVVLQAASEALGDLEATEVLPSLLALLRGPSTAQQRKAIYRAAVKLSSGQAREEVLQELIVELGDPRREVRMRAAEALADTDAPQALEALRRQIARERRPYVVAAFRQNLKRLEQSLSRFEALQERVRQLESKVRELQKRQHPSHPEVVPARER